MYDKLTILYRRLPLLVAAVALLMAPFIVAPSYADEVPFRISYTGTLVPIPIDTNEDDTHATVLDGQSKGTFGPSMSHIVTEWRFTEDYCHGTYGYFELVQAAMVITFSNGDQLLGAQGGTGWMCMDVVPGSETLGHFYGEAYGGFSGGTGRFEGASGTFTSPFEGYNLTGYSFGPIQGSFLGTLILQ